METKRVGMETSTKPRELHKILEHNHMRMLTIKQIANMPAHNLLRYYRKLRKLRNQMNAGNSDIQWDNASAEFQYVDAYTDLIKSTLDTKEHVER